MQARSATAAQPIFYYDLGHPHCYLVAERILTAFDPVAEWEPVLATAVLRTTAAAEPARIEDRVAALGLQPLRWPAIWPPDTTTAMLAATYAKQIGRAVAFSLAAFRQAFAAGRDLGDQDTVLLAAAACEMHPTAVLKGIGLRSVGDALHAANSRARTAGISDLPAIELDGEVFEGPDCVELAHAGIGAAQ